MWNRIEELINHLRNNDIAYIELTPKEVTDYKQEWFNSFVPLDKKEKAISCYCLDGEDYCGYLWHIFSYEIISCLVGNEANMQLNDTIKVEAILLANVDNVAYRIKDISSLKAKDFEVLYDIILTSYDFSWTYAKTHESECGPYFHMSRTV